MLRLASILYSLIGTTVAGTLVIVALTMGLDTLKPIVAAAAIGFALALPITWVVTKGIMGNT
ncbi:MAG: CTP synthetase [Rhodobacteraceae bacterium]|nr:CTP synthetase [Paracoccaceae bacterium]MBT26787.1 CTP synthetase [Paracoccaceae bacterium]